MYFSDFPWREIRKIHPPDRRDGNGSHNALMIQPRQRRYRDHYFNFDDLMRVSAARFRAGPRSARRAVLRITNRSARRDAMRDAMVMRTMTCPDAIHRINIKYCHVRIIYRSRTYPDANTQNQHKVLSYTHNLPDLRILKLPRSSSARRTIAG